MNVARIGGRFTRAVSKERSDRFPAAGGVFVQDGAPV
jgi:hypothetical protein